MSAASLNPATSEAILRWTASRCEAGRSQRERHYLLRLAMGRSIFPQVCSYQEVAGHSRAATRANTRAFRYLPAHAVLREASSRGAEIRPASTWCLREQDGIL